MRNKIKKFIATSIIVSILCMNIVGSNVMAATNTAKTLTETQAFIPIEPRAILQLSKQSWDSNRRVQATLVSSRFST